MNVLLALLIVSAQPVATEQGHHPDAVEVFSCAFEPKWDSNFDRWPDGWQRKTGPKFPHYLIIGIDDQVEAVAGRCLHVRLDGGAATVEGPPILVDSRFSYVLEGKLKTYGLKHDRAFLSVTFYDANRKPLETQYSERLRDVGDWKKVGIGPINPENRNIEMAVIGLHVHPTDRKDLQGGAMFDDIWFARLPRMQLRTNREDNVYTNPNDVRVTCRLSGILERDPEIKFQLLDASSNSIDQTAQTLDGQIIAQKSSKASDLLSHGTNEPAGYSGVAEWRPTLVAPGQDPDNAYGFYRVRVTMRSPKGIMHKEEVTLAVIRPPRNPVHGEFGWSLPRGDDPLPLDALTGLLPHVGINWLKFPVWYGEAEADRGDRLMWFSERLGMKRIEMIGVLDHPPPEVLKHFGEGEQVSAANVFSADRALWAPSLDSVMTRLSLKIRWWQLGGDHDTSFVGYPNLAEKIAAVRKQLYRFGQEVHLGIGWRWLAEMLPDENPPWEFLTMSANPPLTGAEMATYLAASDAKQSKRWALVEPLPRSHYSMETRSRDLVQQMMAAKIEQADGIFVPNPFNTERGLMNDDGTPGELLLPWRTTALVLGGSKYLGSIRMPGGSENHIYTRNREAVMVVWNETPKTESIYLGEDVRQIDIWGRMKKPEQDGHRQIIEVGPLPTFITGINEQVTRWRMAVHFEREQMPSIFGRAHKNGVTMKNFFPQGTGGEVKLVTPKVWNTFPPQMNFKLAVDELLTKPFEVTLKFDASSGQKNIRIDFDINVDRRYRFSVYRDLEIGMGDVVIDLSAKLEANGMLVVQQRMTNHSDKLVDFKCLLHAPNRRRQRTQVYRLGRGQDVKTYRLPNGRQLLGQALWLKAEEIGGQRILNYRFVAQE